MRLNEYLDDITFKSFVKNNDIFELYQSNPRYRYIYRGVDKNIKTYQIFTRRKNRIPRDMDDNYHDLFNVKFQQKFGWKARSEGIFTTSNFKNAEGYGHVYIFIPENNYSFIWSNRIIDLWTEFSSYNRLYGSYLSKRETEILNMNDINSKEVKEIIDRLLKTYTDTNIKNAIISGHEIMFNCNAYMLINLKYFEQEILP